MSKAAVASWEIVKSEDSTSSKSDLLVVEEPLQIRVNFGPLDEREEVDLTITMRTPGNDLELTAGFLLGEGIITSLDDFVHLDHCKTGLKSEELGNVVRVELKPELSFDKGRYDRHFYSSSSCGVCGLGSLEQLRKIVPERNAAPDIRYESEVIRNIPDIIKQSQVNFNHTGGIHAAALLSQGGDVTFCREDVGRHNAVDKVIGASFFDGTFPITSSLLFLSGRAGFELIQKAVMAGIQFVAAVGAPSSLAVELADDHDVTLIGFLRDGKFNVYTGRRRVNF